MFIWTFFHHKDLGNNLLQLCPKVVKHPVYTFPYKSSWRSYLVKSGVNFTFKRENFLRHYVISGYHSNEMSSVDYTIYGTAKKFSATLYGVSSDRIHNPDVAIRGVAYCTDWFFVCVLFEGDGVTRRPRRIIR
jgi:hypothetical protein